VVIARKRGAIEMLCRRLQSAVTRRPSTGRLKPAPTSLREDKNGRVGAFGVRRLAAALGFAAACCRGRVAVLFAYATVFFTVAPLFATNNLAVDRRTVRVGEAVTIIVSLEDEFTSVDSVRVPVRNLTITGPPSVSSEFAFINGAVVRRKVFRFRARANGPGPAEAGPVVISLEDGQRETLRGIAITVLPDRAASSNDPAVVLSELQASSRDPFFIVAEADRTSAFVGEQVVVTWWLYNATNVQQWQIGTIPKLSDFWVEELDVRSTQPTQIFMNGLAIQKMPIRRTVLYPLRSGTLDVGSMEVEAAVLRRSSSSSPFGLFEGSLAEISFASAPITITSRAVPAGPAVAATGDLALRCVDPVQENGGPVVIDAVLTGKGNLRSASPPVFASKVSGSVETVDGGVMMYKTDSDPTMTRRWKYLIFPARAGAMAVPPLQMRVFSPGLGLRQTLRCDARTLNVTAASPPEPESTSRSSQRSRQSRRNAPLIAGGVAAAVIALFAASRLARNIRFSRQVSQVVKGRTPHETRELMNAHLLERGLDPSALMREGSERGDAWRALASLLEALGRERIEMANPEREVKRRVREFLKLT
jgi:hypothetical protein